MHFFGVHSAAMSYKKYILYCVVFLKTHLDTTFEKVRFEKALERPLTKPGMRQISQLQSSSMSQEV